MSSKSRVLTGLEFEKSLKEPQRPPILARVSGSPVWCYFIFCLICSYNGGPCQASPIPPPRPIQQQIIRENIKLFSPCRGSVSARNYLKSFLLRKHKRHLCGIRQVPMTGIAHKPPPEIKVHHCNEVNHALIIINGCVRCM